MSVSHAELAPNQDPGPTTESGLRTELGVLAGVRVLDLTSAWAGPMCGRNLAALGAQVIHVEGPGRMDGWRGDREGGDRTLYPKGDPGARPYNRSSMFNSQNLGKLSLVIDAKDPAGRELLRRVADSCDVILSNFRSGALDRMGLGYAEMSRTRPDIVVVEMPAFGSTGPMAQHGALGPTMELVSGMASLVGYGDGEPIATGPAYLDPIGAYNATAATVTALLERQATGRGMQVEVAQTEAGMSWIGEEFLFAHATGHASEPDGNRVPWAAPHDCYPCAGDDEWVTIAVTDDHQWQQMCSAANFPVELRDRFDTERVRHQDADDLDEAISNWTRSRSKFEVAERLQQAGVAAAPVLNGRDLTQSTYLEERGYFSEFDHPEAGRHRYQGLPFHFSQSRSTPGSAAPIFGQHSREILTQLAGVPAAEVDELIRSGVVFDASQMPVD